VNKVSYNKEEPVVLSKVLSSVLPQYQKMIFWWG